MKKLEQYIKSGWVWSDTTSALVTQVVFEMSPDGRISGVNISKGSGNRAYDDSVLRAIGKASPAPPPPASVYEFFRSVRMTFDPRE
jgi:TolA protein